MIQASMAAAHIRFWSRTDNMTKAIERENITITLTRYREPDWLVNETLDSLAVQHNIAGEIIMLDQAWRQDFANKVAARSTKALQFSCLSCEERGLSFARNCGLQIAANDIVLFIDPDAVADPFWAERLAQTLSSPCIAIAGSRILPKWLGAIPLLAKASVVLDQYSLLDWGEQEQDAARIVGAGFGVRKSAARDEMFFDEALGRREGKLFGGEETDLCARVCAKGGRVVYCGGSIIHHQILPERLTSSWIIRRLYYAGIGRARRGGAPSPSRSPDLWDWTLMPFILPPYMLGYCRGMMGRSQTRILAGEA